MPTYVYRCPDGHELNVTQKMTDPVHIQCGNCHKTMERVLQPALVSVKGGTPKHHKT